MSSGEKDRLQPLSEFVKGRAFRELVNAFTKLLGRAAWLAATLTLAG